MKLTVDETRALDFIRASSVAGTNTTVRGVQTVLKASYGKAHYILCHLRDAGLIDWIDGQRRSMHPTGIGKQSVRPTSIFRIQETIDWPRSKWKPYDGVWLDPKLFNLKSDEKYIVLQAGTLWSPHHFPVKPAEKFVVCISNKYPDGKMSFIRRAGRLEAENVVWGVDVGLRIKKTGQPIANEDFLGVIVSRLSE